ncbi:MAG: hypothetical protein ABIQ70_06710, partial [Dokdonella sp.]
MRMTILAMLCASLYVGAASAATIIVQSTDAAGEGFNDPTARAPEGGNPGTTLGAQRLFLFNAVAKQWAALLKSNIVITISGHFDPLVPCSAGGGVLGKAGPTNFTTLVPVPPGAQSNTFYPQALAEALANANLNGTSTEIDAIFNSSIDTGCLGAGTRFYYGVNPQAATPANTVRLYPTLLHEIGHGLGFVSLVCTKNPSCQSGWVYGGYPNSLRDIWSFFQANATNTGLLWKDKSNAQRIADFTADPNLVWLGANVTADEGVFQPTAAGETGGHMRLYAPATFEPGSSIAHFSKAAANPDLL